MSTHTISNTKIALLFTLFVLAMTFVVYWLAGAPAKAEVSQPMTTNFICEMQGKWSNEHYDISRATYRHPGSWYLTYRDNGQKTTYLQRPGEDCRVESFPKDP